MPLTVPEADDIKYYNLYMKSVVVIPRDGDHRHVARAVGVSRNNDGGGDNSITT